MGLKSGETADKRYKCAHCSLNTLWAHTHYYMSRGAVFVCKGKPIPLYGRDTAARQRKTVQTSYHENNINIYVCSTSYLPITHVQNNYNYSYSYMEFKNGIGADQRFHEASVQHRH